MRKTRARQVGALITGLALVTAACGSDDSSSADSTAEETTADSMSEETTADSMSEETTADSMSEETTADSMSEETTADSMSDDSTAPGATVGSSTDGILRFGGILPETGSLSYLGPPEFAGVQLAVNDINEAGGVLDTDVEWLPGDSGDNGEVANATVDRLLGQAVDTFIGAASSGVSLTVIDKITSNGKIHFSPANTSPQFTDYADSDLYFRTAPSDIIQGDVLANTMIADGITAAAFLVMNDAYGTGLLEYTKGPYEEAGGEIVVEQIYDPKAENFDAEVAKVVEANPDGIVIIGFDETSKILTALIEAGFGPQDVQIYGVDGNISNALASNFSDPTVLTGMRGTFPGVDVAGTKQEFQTQLLEIDPELMDYTYAAESYDAVVVTALAAIIAGTDDPVEVAANINDVTREGEKCMTFADCKELAAAGTDIDYDGVSGELEFIDAGEPSVASVLINEFNDKGELKVVDSVFGEL